MFVIDHDAGLACRRCGAPVILALSVRPGILPVPELEFCSNCLAVNLPDGAPAPLLTSTRIEGARVVQLDK